MYFKYWFAAFGSALITSIYVVVYMRKYTKQLSAWKNNESFPVQFVQIKRRFSFMVENQRSDNGCAAVLQ